MPRVRFPPSARHWTHQSTDPIAGVAPRPLPPFPQQPSPLSGLRNTRPGRAKPGTFSSPLRISVMPAKLDLTGKRFGRLVTVRHAQEVAGPKAATRWECICDCGTHLLASTRSLRSGHTKSCGCLQKERVTQRSTRHGLTKTPTWRAWRAMVARCTVSTNASYPSYGGRGISVCPRWRQFENFLADMGDRPSGTTIDRVDNDGNYEPANCRWATREQQDSNKRATVRITFQGRTMTLAQWAKELGTSGTALRKRWAKYQTLRRINRT
jgi:hypothetical protein